MTERTDDPSRNRHALTSGWYFFLPMKVVEPPPRDAPVSAEHLSDPGGRDNPGFRRLDTGRSS
ncbi:MULTISPECIES: hypothetical protein [unclassified Rhodococcus (in: high G+C Gram-positive bacteria)]|uniref:hypothetical protein n=1 Tax=unclassified Rhodococcus (in: high G+C Gram-positive bacteria) TaxID=192944 RepID=UPI001C9AE97B|nr:MULTISPECIES: hypothetical protein [unclassified Rhodococcus (in: high G+C Gram-positive bacteria)]MBY6597450.1 hypothetical protein [Rhodococcus sp. BP-353]MBY6623476.1 hypothetical protein [Rhodococcus sp. BP-350]MBY6668431.1 hypothetical protein [Rhodococcus sp. BP-334]